MAKHNRHRKRRRRRALAELRARVFFNGHGHSAGAHVSRLELVAIVRERAAKAQPAVYERQHRPLLPLIDALG